MASSTAQQALFVRPEWCNKILHQNKRWEVRGFNTKKRGTYSRERIEPAGWNFHPEELF